MKHISSPHNSLIRKIQRLQRKSRARKNESVFVIEGKRELSIAAQEGYELDTIFICPEIFDSAAEFSEDVVIKLLNLKQQTEIIAVSIEVYDKVAYRGGTEGCIAFAKARTHDMDSLKINSNSLILIAEAPEKPGNLGALLRTADAAKLDAVIIANPKTDLYNPNVIRSSVGCVFSVPVATGSTIEVVQWLNKNRLDLYAATLQNSNRYDLEDYTRGCAIAVGTEATGLSKDFRQAAKACINIPMSGAIDSMNVSVSAAILVFEAKRQRNFLR